MRRRKMKRKETRRGEWGKGLGWPEGGGGEAEGGLRKLVKIWEKDEEEE